MQPPMRRGVGTLNRNLKRPGHTLRNWKFANLAPRARLAKVEEDMQPWAEGCAEKAPAAWCSLYCELILILIKAQVQKHVRYCAGEFVM
mmetsp:Transcript_50966/g.85210  ORF Transcript_50966/g.85210 Transcript_50966/m.85210 type:complete len:89 (-) Transcript_50966:385-651(-)